jgi:hypothetical protein
MGGTMQSFYGGNIDGFIVCYASNLRGRVQVILEQPMTKLPYVGCRFEDNVFVLDKHKVQGSNPQRLFQ